jgi:hypothetical protein
MEWLQKNWPCASSFCCAERVGAMNLSGTQKDVLLALHHGQRLKSHRYLSGAKSFRLHSPDGSTRVVRRATVEALLRLGLIVSNQKFPSAVYWLTEKGSLVVRAIAEAGE